MPKRSVSISRAIAAARSFVYVGLATSLVTTRSGLPARAAPEDGLQEIAPAMGEQPSRANDVMPRINPSEGALAIPFAVAVGVDGIGLVDFGIRAIQCAVKDFVRADVEHGNTALCRDRSQVPGSEPVDAQGFRRIERAAVYICPGGRMQDDIRANVGDKLPAGFVIANVQFMADRANNVGIGDFVPVAEARDEQAAQSTASAS